MNEERSFEVTVLGTVMLLYGLWLLCVPFLGPYYRLPVLRSGLFLLFLTPAIFAKDGSIFSFIISIFIGFACLIAGVFVLKLRNWARKLAVRFSALVVLGIVCVLVYAFIDLLTLQGNIVPVSLGIGTLILMIPSWPFLLFLYFFTRPRIKEQFK